MSNYPTTLSYSTYAFICTQCTNKDKEMDELKIKLKAFESKQYDEEFKILKNDYDTLSKINKELKQKINDEERIKDLQNNIASFGYQEKRKLEETILDLEIENKKLKTSEDFLLLKNKYTFLMQKLEHIKEILK